MDEANNGYSLYTKQAKYVCIHSSRRVIILKMEDDHGLNDASFFMLSWVENPFVQMEVPILMGHQSDKYAA